jgi:hypothetical protein
MDLVYYWQQRLYFLRTLLNATFIVALFWSEFLHTDGSDAIIRAS